MIYKVLVVDDDLSEREPHYRKLFELTSKISGYKFKMTWIRDGDDIATEIGNSRFDLILADVILDVNWRYNLQNLFDLLDKSSSYDSPVVLVSLVWNDTNDKTLKKALSSTRWKAFFKWESISSPSGGDLTLHARQLQGLLIQHQSRNSMYKTIDSIDDEIRIVHFSDLRAGSIGFKDAYTLAQHSAGSIYSHMKKPPHFIFVTGDVSETGIPEQFDSASKWFNIFKSALDSPSIFFVPGNHDLCLPLAGSSSLNWNGSHLEYSPQNDTSETELFKYSLYPYRNFCSTYYGDYVFNELFEDGSWIIDFFLSSGLLIYGLNTSNLSFPVAPPKGTLPENTIERIFDKIAPINRKHNNLFTIGLAHHCPVAIPNYEHVTNPEKFYSCFNGAGKIRTDLFLCGHTHRQDTTKVFMAGYDMILGVSPYISKDVPSFTRGFNLIKIRRNGSGQFSNVAIDSAIISMGKFKKVYSVSFDLKPSGGND